MTQLPPPQADSDTLAVAAKEAADLRAENQGLREQIAALQEQGPPKSQIEALKADYEGTIAQLRNRYDSLEKRYEAERGSNDKWGLPKGYRVMEVTTEAPMEDATTGAPQGSARHHKFQAVHKDGWEGSVVLEYRQAYRSAWEEALRRAGAKKKKGGNA